MAKMLALALTVLAVFGAAPRRALQPPQTGFDVRPAELLPRSMKIEDIDDITSRAVGGPGRVWQTPVPRTTPVGAGVRIHIKVTKPEPSATWKVVVLDDGMNVVETIEGKTLAAAGEWWTDEVPTSRAHVQLWVDSAAPEAQIVIDKYMFQVNPATNQGIIGQDNTLPITDHHLPQYVRDMGASVARLRILVPDGEALCTGFLVGASLLMTNEHCISTDAQTAGAVAEFNYDSETASPRRYRIVKLEASDFGLDYALVRLSAPVTGQSRMFLDRTAAVQGARLFVVQHPEGKPKRAAFWPNCSVQTPDAIGRAATSTDFKHVCDTKPGSSGAPVLDWTTKRVVGLHHLGYPEGQEQLVNQAVHIRDIAAQLKTKVSAEIFNEVMRPQ
jgi:V8-like Glu-specific endopeptidase